MDADRVKQALEIERKHQDFVQNLEKEKAIQEKDFANRQQENERVQKEKDARYANELDQARLHGGK